MIMFVMYVYDHNNNIWIIGLGFLGGSDHSVKQRNRPILWPDPVIRNADQLCLGSSRPGQISAWSHIEPTSSMLGMC